MSVRRILRWCIWILAGAWEATWKVHEKPPLPTGAGSLVLSPRLGLPLLMSAGQPLVEVVVVRSMVRPLRRLLFLPFRREPKLTRGWLMGVLAV